MDITQREADVFADEVESMGYEVEIAYVDVYGSLEIHILRNNAGDPDEWEFDIKDLARDMFEDIDVTFLNDKQMVALIYG